MREINFLQKFAHNKLGWGYPILAENSGDGFQPVYKCLCGVEVTQDSTGAWFHLGKDHNTIN